MESTSLKIELPKFSGYDSKMDIYSFQVEFEKLIAPEIQRKFQPEYLKRNYLDGHALLLVKEVDDLESIWKKLKESFGCTMMLLQNKLSDVKSCGPIWKVTEKPKLLQIISKLINGMTELESLASKHSIEDQLYHHSYISMVFDLIGDQRREKFAYKYAGETMTCKVKWQKIREYLSKETKVWRT